MSITIYKQDFINGTFKELSNYFTNTLKIVNMDDVLKIMKYVDKNMDNEQKKSYLKELFEASVKQPCWPKFDNLTMDFNKQLETYKQNPTHPFFKVVWVGLDASNNMIEKFIYVTILDDDSYLKYINNQTNKNIDIKMKQLLENCKQATDAPFTCCVME